MRRTTVARLVPTVLVVALVACGGTAPASPTMPVPSAAGSPAPSAPPAPLESGPLTPASLPGDIPQARLDVTVAPVLASGEITPEAGGTITATTADGVTWTLRVGPWAVRAPVAVELRPLAGSSALGRVVAGVDLAPAGLRLAEPGTLTATGVVVPPTVVGLEYRGDAARADARLVIGPGTADGSLAFSVAHFSGNVAVDVGAEANALYEKWSAARGGDTPEARQAAAETRYAAADLAERNGRVSAETAADIKSRAMVEWMEAEADRVANNPELTKLAQSGDPRDLDVIDAELGRLLQVEHQLGVLSEEARPDGIEKVIATLEAYETAIVEKVMDSQRIQDAASSGRVSDMGDVIDVITVVLTLERRLALLGSEGSGVLAKIAGLIERLRTSLLESCRQAPLDPAIVLGLERMVQLLGGSSAATITQVLECVEPQGWLVEAADSFIAGSQRLCAANPLDIDPVTGEAGVYVERNGGMPDDWPAGKTYELDDGILLTFITTEPGRKNNSYDVYFVKGTAKSGTIYEFHGRFAIVVGTDGLPRTGSGTGEGRIVHPDGSTEHRPDTLTITFSRIPEPAWCSAPAP